MKNFVKVGIFLTCFWFMAFKIPVKIKHIQYPLEAVQYGVSLFIPEIETTELELELKNHDAFLNELGFVESGNDYEKVNRLGYMGKYQFGKKTLNLLDIKTSKKEFLNDPDLQEYAVSRLLEENRKTLSRFIEKYDGKIVHDILVTESGILAAAHLGGAGKVARWFRSGKDFEDANGTSITSYMKKFSGYTLNLN